jgi:hypothetical protein
MTKKPDPTITVRMTVDDRKVFNALMKKLGVGISPIFRLALRALATKEGVTL